MAALFVLAISLAVNIAVVGAIGGVALRFSSGKVHLKERQMNSIYMRALSRDQRRELGRQIRDQIGNSAAIKTDVEADFRDAIRILRGEDFDIKTFKSVFKTHVARSYQRLENAEEVLSSYILLMSYSERLSYANRMEKALNRGPRSRR